MNYHKDQNIKQDNHVVMRVITKRLLTIKEASVYLGISERQLEYLCHDGQMKQTRLPNTKKRLYDIMDLDEFVDRSKRA